MKQIVIQDQLVDAAPRTTEESLYPNIDDTYTVRTYTGERLIIRSNQSYGIKQWGTGMETGMQGMAIYEDIMVRGKNSTDGGHKIYHIGIDGSLIELATFNLDLGHANSFQFAPILEAGQTYPYLYVSPLNHNCHVLSIASDYTVSIVQTITIDGVSQILKGDDGYIWTSTSKSDNTREFVKYRKVSVGEGDVTLTDDDILDSFCTNEAMPTSQYTPQGWLIKSGKIWYTYGWPNLSQKSGLKVFSTATHRLLGVIDLTGYVGGEIEDCDIYDNSLIVATHGSAMYMLKF